MSIRIMSMVWDNGPRDKADILILLALADYCNDEGECWPAVASIAKKARMTERGAQKIIARLAETGWVEIEPGGGRKNCNLYRIKNPEPRSPRTTFTPNTDAETPNPMTETPNTVPKNPEPRSPEPSVNRQEPSRTVIMQQDEFDAFWQVVPRKKGKGAAEKAFTKARKIASIAEIIDGMERYARQREGQDPQYTCHPATWLNQKRWTDENDHTQADFHREVEKMLGDRNGIQRTSEINHHEPQQLFAPVPAPDASGHGMQLDRDQDDSRGDEQSHLSLIKPRRFGGTG